MYQFVLDSLSLKNDAVYGSTQELPSCFFKMELKFACKVTVHSLLNQLIQYGITQNRVYSVLNTGFHYYVVLVGLDF